MHDNQLPKIAQLVNSKGIQFVREFRGRGIPGTVYYGEFRGQYIKLKSIVFNAEEGFGGHSIKSNGG